MNFIKSITFFIFTLGSCVWLFAQNKNVYIAVLDSPIDYSHPDIQAVLDEDLLKTSTIYDSKMNEKSWYELNQLAKKEFEKRMGEGTYTGQVNYYAATKKQSSQLSLKEKAERVYTLIEGNLKYIFSKKFRSGLQLVGNYIHGTHVAGIAFKSLTDVKLINFPIIRVQPNSKLKLSDILNYDIHQYKADLKSYYQQITEVLKKNNIQVVNMSYSAPEEMLLNNLMNKSSLLMKTFYKGEIQKMSKELAEAFIDELQFFIESNPQSVFVTSAGNEGKSIAPDVKHKVNIQANNLIKVAAIDKKGKVALFSNTSPTQVDIAALGVNISSALVGGGEINMSGTSQSTPMVANALAVIFKMYPDLKPSEAIAKLYEFSTSNPSLQNQIKNGRMLGPLSEEQIHNSLPANSCHSFFWGF